MASTQCFTDTSLAGDLTTRWGLPQLSRLEDLKLGCTLITKISTTASQQHLGGFSPKIQNLSFGQNFSKSPIVLLF